MIGAHGFRQRLAASVIIGVALSLGCSSGDGEYGKHKGEFAQHECVLLMSAADCSMCRNPTADER